MYLNAEEKNLLTRAGTQEEFNMPTQDGCRMDACWVHICSRSTQTKLRVCYANACIIEMLNNWHSFGMLWVTAIFNDAHDEYGV